MKIIFVNNQYEQELGIVREYTDMYNTPLVTVLKTLSKRKSKGRESERVR